MRCLKGPKRAHLPYLNEYIQWGNVKWFFHSYDEALRYVRLGIGEAYFAKIEFKENIHELSDQPSLLKSFDDLITVKLECSPILAFYLM